MRSNENAVLSLKKWKNAVLSLKTAFFLFFFQKKNFGREGGCMRCEATDVHQRNENAVLRLKKWKNAVLSLKTAFFLFFFSEKKNLRGRADAKQRNENKNATDYINRTIFEGS